MWNSGYYVLLKVSFYLGYYSSNEIVTRVPLPWTLESLLSYLGSRQTFNMMLSHPSPSVCDLRLLCYLVGHLCDMCDGGTWHLWISWVVEILHYYAFFINSLL